MTERKKKIRAFLIPLFVIILGIFNYAKLSGTENIRAIHIVTLITIGMAIGVLLRNIITYFSKDQSIR